MKFRTPGKEPGCRAGDRETRGPSKSCGTSSCSASAAGQSAELAGCQHRRARPASPTTFPTWRQPATEGVRGARPRAKEG
eukprot:9501751-Pyramimonas_sp.AAC.1